MRGASALQDALAAVPSSSLQALVVWEKVLETDQKPAAETLGLISDRRATQYWDPGQVVSKAILAAAEIDPALLQGQSPEVVWDVVAVFEPGARWDTVLPRPAYHGFPVVDSIGAAKGTMARLTRGR